MKIKCFLYLVMIFSWDIYCSDIVLGNCSEEIVNDKSKDIDSLVEKNNYSFDVIISDESLLSDSEKVRILSVFNENIKDKFSEDELTDIYRVKLCVYSATKDFGISYLKKSDQNEYLGGILRY